MRKPLGENPIELSRAAKRLFMRPVARNPDRDVWLLQRFGQKLHLAELIILPLVVERFTTPQAHQNRKTLIKHLSIYSLIRWLTEIVIFSKEVGAEANPKDQTPS